MMCLKSSPKMLNVALKDYFNYWTSLLFGWQADDTIINSLVSVLTAEEQALGLEQPQGVGQRPRPLNLDCYPHGTSLQFG